MFGSDGSPIIQYLVIFAIIFSVLAAIVFLVRRFTGGGGALQSRGARARQPRLGIIDVYELDRSRQLILLRRDNVEHLLLVGGPNDVVVERNIQRGQRPLPETTLRAETAAEPLPDPLAEAGRLPEPPRALPESPSIRMEPAFEMPVVVPAPVPHSDTLPPVRLPLDAALIAGDEPGRDISVADAMPIPAREPVTRPRPRTTPPPLDRPLEPETARPADPGLVLPPVAPPPTDPRPAAPSALSDMARHLQAAIARPSPVASPPPPVPVPPPPPKPEAIDPIAAAMASLLPPQPEPTAKAEPAVTAPAPASPEPSPAPVAPPLPAAPPPRPARPAEKAKVARPEPEQDATAAGNPFSVEEIEAEFARLLGRPIDKR